MSLEINGLWLAIVLEEEGKLEIIKDWQQCQKSLLFSTQEVFEKAKQNNTCKT